MKDSPFFQQAFLMLQVLPYALQEECFGLKGGTAINLFVRDTPRLSVDIDLTYLPLEPREDSLNKIDQSLRRIAKAIQDGLRSVKVKSQGESGSGRIFKLLVGEKPNLIKIEPNTIIRGVITQGAVIDLSVKAQELFGVSVSARVLSFLDLYGGKICAALDRQHPRDLFDIKLLLEQEGITDEVRKSFLIYLISHPRPIHELLDPKLKDIQTLFKAGFIGMTDQEVSCEDLVEARRTLIETLKKELTQDERKFLLSVKEMNPNWGLLGLEGIEKLPAVKWKLENLGKMKPKLHSESVKNLKRILGL